MSPELSRRVAKIMQTETIAKLTPDERIKFTKEVAHAESFESLSEETQQMVLEAEASKN